MDEDDMYNDLGGDGDVFANDDDIDGGLRDDLDEAIAQGHLPIKSTDGIDATKIRNFANDASQ